MASDTMDLHELADYLRRDRREVNRLADRGSLPGRKVSGEWRFARAEIDHWLETQLPAYTEEQLHALESRDHADSGRQVLVSELLKTCNMAVPLAASTRASVLKELVGLAEQSWQVYDPAAILDAIRQREDLGTTALECGVAFPHPRRPRAGTLGDSVLAYARTPAGIPFGAPRGGLTDIFFLVCCQDEKTHLRVLARLSRLLLRPDFVAALREAECVDSTFQVIEDAERALSFA
jgi:PTS system nitrogen regulatory IIA component